MLYARGCPSAFWYYVHMTIDHLENNKSNMFNLLLRKSFFYWNIPRVTIPRWYSSVSQQKNGTFKVILFPGQGSQFVGMTERMKDNGAVKTLFENANEILGYNLLEKCLHGPKEELDKTIYCQPAIFIASLAALELYKEKTHESEWHVNNMLTAGFSVGEYASLVLSKSLAFEDALRLLDIRAKAMQKASEATPSGMVTVIGLNKDGIQNLLKSARDFLTEKQIWNKTISIGNYLYSKGFVLAGHEEAIQYVLKFGVTEHGAKRTTRLPVSGAFHTVLMKSAQESVANALNSMNVQMPQIQVYCNVTGKPYESGEQIKSLLPRQLVEPVRWHDVMLNICASQEQERTFYELGPGRQLTSILAKINRRLVKHCTNIEV